jgi:hypothetical protein
MFIADCWGRASVAALTIHDTFLQPGLQVRLGSEDAHVFR